MTLPKDPQVEHRARLHALCRELLGERRLIVASNRGPVEYDLASDGALLPRRGRGGLVAALSPVGQLGKMTWIASAMGEADRRAVQAAAGAALKPSLPGLNIDVRLVVCSRNTYHKYYNVVSNPLLWFLQHNMWNAPYTPNIDASTYDAWHSGYVTVNNAFGQAILEELRREDASRFVILHDYQLYLVGKLVREAAPDVRLLHMVHVPWPSPSFWRLLPPPMRRAICEGLCANDIVGFQSQRSARAFLYTVQTFLEEAEVDVQGQTINYGGRLTQVAAYPLSIDVASIRRTGASPRVREYEEGLRARAGELNIVRVDRVDPSRNIVRGFRAFDTLLQRHPGLVGRVKFLAFLTPARARIREYQRNADDLMATANQINERYARENWRPIELFLENNYLQALAGLRLYDVLLVNAIVDGMNLVAKEGPVVNTRDGVLVLSEGTGAYEQLHDATLAVTPTDLEGTAQALYDGLTMPPAERSRRAELLRKLIGEEDLTMWLYHQFAGLYNLVQGSPGATTPATHESKP